MLGICNGFQILCEAHLLPGALTRNDHLHFVCRDQALRDRERRHRLDPRLRSRASRSSIPLKNGEGGYVADDAHAGRARGRGPGRRPLRRRQPERLATATSPASRNERGNVVGLMPHPEHAVEALTGPSTDGLGFFTSRARTAELVDAATSRHVDTVKDAERDARRRAAVRRARPQGTTSTQRIREILGRRPTSAELAMYSVMWSEHCSYKSSQGAPAPVRREGAADRRAARRHRRERRRRRHRRRLGGDLQGRVAQPPVATSSPTRARRPASAASCATSCPWAPARSR